MRISYIRALCHTSQGKQRTGQHPNGIFFNTLTEVVPASELACQSRDQVWFKLTQPIVGTQAGPSLLTLQLIDVTVAV